MPVVIKPVQCQPILREKVSWVHYSWTDIHHKKSIKFTKERPVLNVSSVTSEVIIKVVLSTTYKQPIRNFHFKVIFFKSMNIDIQSAQEFIQTIASANSLLRPPAANLHFYVLGTIYRREEYTWCFSHSPKLVGPWSCGHPVGGWLTNWSSDWTAENKHVPARWKAEHREAMSGMFCKRCGVEKISKHYRVVHWSVPCRPLFLTVLLYIFYVKKFFITSET